MISFHSSVYVSPLEYGSQNLWLSGTSINLWSSLISIRVIPYATCPILLLKAFLTAGESTMTSAAAGISFKWNTPQQVIAASVVLPALGLIAVSLRFRVRCIQKASIGLDDWTILFAMVSYWLFHFWRC